MRRDVPSVTSVTEAPKSRAERFAEAQARVLANHAETFRKLAQ
ncbi:MAG: hypothetical protein ACREJX_18090 [Polyangiaceae bacterium]